MLRSQQEEQDEGDIGLFSLSSHSQPHLRNYAHTDIHDSSLMNPWLLPDSTRAPLPSPVRSRTLPRTRRKSSQTLTPELEPDKLRLVRRWILGLVIVNFDLEFGPVVHSTFPRLWLSSSEAENIAFSSFPDSPQFDEGSQIHSFRLRDSGSPGESRSGYNDRPASPDGFIYGYSYFTQQKDITLKRGYLQQSLVILTHHPYPALFCALISTLGPLYLSHGLPMLETAGHNIASWPDLVKGGTSELGFLGTVFEVDLPKNTDEQQLLGPRITSEKYAHHHILASIPFQSLPIVSLLEASLSHLWSIWECLVLCDPILIYGPSPSMTSEVVWWLRDMLRPIPVGGDFRPYFTIHDQDHSAIINKMPPKLGVLVGVTNPFIERACKHWPHILSLGSNAKTDKSGKNRELPGPKPGWETKTHNRYISKDRLLLKRIEDACRGDDRAKVEASLAIRRHFCSRTTELLVPLHRYLNTLIPSPSESSTLMTRNRRLKPFSTKDFLASLKANGSPLPFRSTARRSDFYGRWLKTPAFGLWLAHQEEVVQRALRENAERR